MSKEEKNSASKNTRSSSSSSSSSSTRPCAGNKCANSCNGDLCALGKDAINFNLWIQQLVDTGAWIMGNADFSNAINNTKIDFTNAVAINGKKGIKLNYTKTNATTNAKPNTLPPVPVNTEDSWTNELNYAFWIFLLDMTDVTNITLVYDNSQLIVGHTYAIGVFDYDNSELGDLYIILTVISFIYSQPSDIQLIGNPLHPVSPDEVIAVVAYLNERINCLNVPCCVKERVTDAIMNYVNKFLNPQDPDGNVNALLSSLAKQEFTSFCDEDIIPECGPIYIANIVMNEWQQEELNYTISYWAGETGSGSDNAATITSRINSLNFIINLLRTAQYYLQTYLSTRCCCSGGCKEGDKHLSAEKACKFVFGRFCVVDVPLPAFDFLFDDWVDNYEIDY